MESLREQKGHRRAGLKFSLVATLLLLFSAYIVRAALPLSDLLRYTPLSLVSLSSSTLPAEVQALEARTVGLAFDRDTETEFTAYAVTQIEVQLESATRLQAIKVYGSAPYTLSLYAQSNGSYQPITEWQNIDLSTQSENWHSFSLATAITTAKLRFDITPKTDSNATGLKEIELWGIGARLNISNSARVLNLSADTSLPAQLRRYPANLEQGVIGATADREDDLSDNNFRVLVDRTPTDFKRLYLAYDVYGLGHWTNVVRRINNNPVQGGFQHATNTTWTTHIEPLNPAWIVQGENQIVFSVPAQVTGTYTVKNLRLIGELDNGANLIQSLSSSQPDDSGNRVSSVGDGDLNSGWRPYPTGGPLKAGVPTLEYALDKLTQLDGLSFYLVNNLKGDIRIEVRRGDIWQDAGMATLDGRKLTTGWNTANIPLTTPVEGVRLSFQNGQGSSAEIKELHLIGSGVGKATDPARIVVSYPDAGQYYGRQAYVRGFLQPAQNTAGPAQLFIGGKAIQTPDGAFGVRVNKDELGFGQQGDSEPWSVELKAVYPNNHTVIATVVLNNHQPALESTDANLLPTYTVAVPPGQAKKIYYDAAALDIGTDALFTDTTLGITPLNDDELPALDPGMTNVTKGPRRGYRFTPHPMKFKSKIKVNLPYNKSLIPPGLSEEDIKTFYFDDQTGRWQPLERAAIDTQGQTVTSLTDHFTDMINATVTVPDHPEAVSFNPTSMKDIKAADPGSQVNLIEPPGANNTGDARLSYPIEVPPGRAGLQPSLAVQYNSSGGNGWMGLGWDLSTQAISIDTRFGVPRYSATHETETYTLNGEMLTPVAHREALTPRDTSGAKRFHARVEGQFRKIIRHGTSPTTYTWEVIDKNGTQYFYGRTSTSAAVDSDSILGTNGGSGNLFYWALTEVRDPNGNFLRHRYQRIANSGVANGDVPGYQLYPDTITYTGHGSTEGQYQVKFLRDRELRESPRTDIQIDARGGFKRVTADLLRHVEVRFGGALIRRYEFNYNDNPYGDGRAGTAFHKTLLSTIVQKDGEGAEFNRHRFEYNDEARNASGVYNGFSGSSNWTVGSDSVSAGIMGQGAASALGGTSSSGGGGHIYIGIGVGDQTDSKTETAGIKIGYNRSKSDGLLTMADMNGDGLPDKVFKGGGFSYRPNLSGPGGGTSFGDPVSLAGMPGILRETVTSTTIGGQSYFGLPVMFDNNRATSQADTYLTDVNGDGITDVVSGGRALFGFVNAQGQPRFSADSGETPAPIGSGSVDTDGLLEDASDIEAERAQAFPLLDTVRRWVAPFDGVIRIDAPARLIQDTSEDRAAYTGADGVRVAIQLEAAELWATSIAANNYDLQTPTGVNSVTVRRGDRIYFRVQSVFDGAYDQVAWNPQITYLSVDSSRTDVNDLPVYVYQAAQDFTLAGRRSTLTVPLTGSLHLAGSWEKSGVTTDDVTLLITRNGNEVYRRTLAHSETATINLSQDVAVTKLDVLEWRILVDSPIDASRIKLAPRAYYTAADGVERVTDDDGNYVITVQPPYDMDLYPVNALTAPQAHYTAAATGEISTGATLTVSGLAAGQATQGVFTIKRRGALLAKKLFTVTGTGSPVTVTVPLNANVVVGDQLFFDISSRDTAFATRLTALEVVVGATTVVPAAVHVTYAGDLFAQPYREWGSFGYKGNAPYDSAAIDQSVVFFNQDYSAETARVYPFAPVPDKAQWGGLDENVWVRAAEISSSRLGLDDIRMPRSENFAGASAVPRISRSTNKAANVGIGGSAGHSDSQLDFQDLNGDRFPDVIGQGGVQYTPMIGGLEATKTGGAGLGSARRSRNKSFQGSTDGLGSIAIAIAGNKGNVAPDGGKTATTAKQGSDLPSLGFSGGGGSADTEYDLIDINADGLPDKVYENGTASLNLGYSFALEEPWSGGAVNKGVTVNTGVNMGFNTDYYSLAGGLSLGTGTTRSDETYADINGDGLPDKIYPGSPLQVRLNTGNGFADTIPWTGGHGSVAVDKHISLGGGFYFTFGFTIYDIIKVVFSPGFDVSTSMGRPEFAFRDVDGDGYPDHLRSERDSELKVALNPIGRTNLLKKVYRPLGASFSLEYKRDGNTYDLPQSRWLLSKVSVHDGHVGDGADLQLRTFGYQEPKYNRLEREFYGYRTVTEQQLDTQNNNSVYRIVTREFRTDSYYTKGLVIRELLQDGQGRPFTETENQYQLRDEGTGLPLSNPLSTTATVFPQLIRTDRRFYEGGTSAEKSTYTTHSYDKFGNVTSFADAGDTPANDDVQANIEYSGLDSACESRHIVGIARKIEVYGNGALMRHRQSMIDCLTGDVTQVRQYLADGRVATTDLQYFANGNLRTVTGPLNKNSQRYVLSYEYDPVVSTHVAKITDSFGLSSQVTHNYLFGRPETTIDTNGNQNSFIYDTLGRVDYIVGPYEQYQAQPTIDFEYHPEASVPWAITRHVDKDAAGAYKSSGSIDTVLFTDGLKRVLQTKKDVTVLEINSPQDRMSVSGRVTFDAFGRTVAQRYPVTEGLGQPGLFNPTYDTVPPTVTEHDVLDRAVKTTIPDGSFTSIAYGFGPDRAGTTQFETVVRDGNVTAGLKAGVKFTYRDVRDLITAVKELNKSGSETLWTSYTYDPLKQIVEVKDDQGNLTKVSYDNFGRRTDIANPDTGLTTFGYDLASNLTSKVTANLKAANQALTYDYDFNRLKSVAFPANPHLSIAYTYGAPAAPNNTAGRITRVVSHTTATSQGNLQDSEERHYGKLGEVTYEKKTVVTFSDPLHPSVFETRYKYDTFGRLLDLTYPDGELLTNVYDSGGNLKSAEGVKGVSTASSGVYRYRYLHNLYYDKFEQRVLMEQGNGVKTAYTYDAETRRLHTLTAGKSGGTLFQNLSYSYDKVGNILSLKNLVDLPHANTYGGPAYQRYEYDDLYRLTQAQGVFPYNKTGSEPDASACNGAENSHCHVYRMDMAYNTLHNIQSKNQLDTRYPPGNATGVVQKKTSYHWNYDYNPSGPSSVRPHAPTHIGQLSYQYDANGNQLGWTHDQNGTRRTLVWDEENRIQSLTDNGHTKTYKYDDQGNRTIKRGPQGETVYVNQFFTQRPGANGTKHVYAGTSRIVSKLMKQDVVGANPHGKTPYEKDLYFYHPDHLGTSNYITDTNGKLYEHLEYFPFGEAWVEENSNSQRTPYLFTGKELDEETGLYYFGARYYDPRTSVWQSADPAFGAYLPFGGRTGLPAMGGIFNGANLGLYSYSHGNPIKYVDPDGRWPSEAVHYAETKKWAMSEGMRQGHAERVARATANVDDVWRGKSWMPAPIGDQSYHFNTNSEGRDARQVRHEEHFASAVKWGQRAAAWRTNEGGLIGWFKNLVASVMENISLKQLGTSLHPLQDTDAHTDEFSKKFMGVHYHDQPAFGTPDMADDYRGEVPGSRGKERLAITEQKTKQAVRDYMNAVGYDKQ